MVRIRKMYKSAKVFVDKTISYLKSFQSSDTHIFGHCSVCFLLSLYFSACLEGVSGENVFPFITSLIVFDSQNSSNLRSAKSTGKIRMIYIDIMFMWLLLVLHVAKTPFDLCPYQDASLNGYEQPIDQNTESSKFIRWIDCCCIASFAIKPEC